MKLMLRSDGVPIYLVKSQLLQVFECDSILL